MSNQYDMDAMDIVELGQILKDTRASLKLEQEDVAGTKKAVKTLSRIEGGKGNPTLGTINEFAKALGLALKLVPTTVAKSSPQSDTLGIGPAARLLTKLDKAPILRAVVLSLVLGENDHILSVELRAFVKQCRSKLEVL